MPCIRIPSGRPGVPDTFLSVTGTYKPGDPMPSGYMDRQEWAAVQMKAGLKQKICGRCRRYCFPQQLSDTIDSMEAYTKKHGGEKVTLYSAVCLECLAKKEQE